MKAAVPELATLALGKQPPGSGESSPSPDASASSGPSGPSSRRRRWRSSCAAVPLAYPARRVVHIVRDGRDVVCSLLEKPWLRREQAQADDAGVPYGAYARFWVEPERRGEFEIGERRTPRGLGMAKLRHGGPCGRRARSRSGTRISPPIRQSRGALADDLGVAAEPLAARSDARTRCSVGRYRTDLDAAQLADVEEEAGALLASSATSDYDSASA